MCEYFSQVHAAGTRGSRHQFDEKRPNIGIHHHPPHSPIYHNKWVERATCGLLIFLGPKNCHIFRERQVNVSIKNVDFVPKTMFRSVCSSIYTFSLFFSKITIFPRSRLFNVECTRRNNANHTYLLYNRMQVGFTLWHHLLKKGKRRKLEMVPTSIHRR